MATGVGGVERYNENKDFKVNKLIAAAGITNGSDASSLIGFYGATPVVQPAATAQSAVATTTINAVGSTTLTAADLTTLNSIQARVVALTTLTNQIRSNLVTLGLIKGSN